MPWVRDRARALQLPVGPALRLGAASYVAMGITIVQALIVARILGPQSAGVWLALQLIMTYGINYHLGVCDSVQQQLPTLAGQGRGERGVEYARSGAGLLWVLTGAWTIVGVVVSLLAYGGHRPGALVLVLCTVLEVWTAFGLTILRAHSRFDRVGAITLARAVVTLLLLPLVWRFQLPGVYARQLLIAVLLLWFTWRSVPIACFPRRDGEDWGRLLRDGLPLLAVGFTFSVQVSLDRALVASLLGTQALGQYYIAAMLLSLLIVLPGVVAQTAYPEMLRTFGATRSPRALRPRVLRHAAVAGIAAAVAACLVGALLPWFTHTFLPRYAEGIRAAQWVLPGIVALSASMPASYFLQTVRRQRQHLLISLSALATHVLLVGWVARRGGGIDGVAVATSVAYAIYATGLFWAFLRHASGAGPAGTGDGQAVPASPS